MPFVAILICYGDDSNYEDAEGELDEHDSRRFGQLVYADDTLLMTRTNGDMEQWLHVVQTAASTMVLEMHWGKLQLLRIRCQGRVRAPQGEEIAAKDSMSYIGTTLHNDGRAGGELTRRLGMAFADFSNLEKINYGDVRISGEEDSSNFSTPLSFRSCYIDCALSC